LGVTAPFPWLDKLVFEWDFNFLILGMIDGNKLEKFLHSPKEKGISLGINYTPAYSILTFKVTLIFVRIQS